MILKLLISAYITIVAMGQIPIPKRELGFTYAGASPAATIQIEMFLDPLCSDSSDAFPWAVMAADFFGPNTVRLVTHLMPLPYNRNSFTAAKSVHAVDNMTSSVDPTMTEWVYDWLGNMFACLDRFDNNATYNLNQEQVNGLFINFTKEMRLDVSQFSKLMTDDNIELNTRLDWKYSASRGIAWTPAFMINNVVIQEASHWRLTDWVRFIDGLLGRPFFPPTSMNEKRKFKKRTLRVIH